MEFYFREGECRPTLFLHHPPPTSGRTVAPLCHRTLTTADWLLGPPHPPPAWYDVAVREAVYVRPHDHHRDLATRKRWIEEGIRMDQETDPEFETKICYFQDKDSDISSREKKRKKNGSSKRAGKKCKVEAPKPKSSSKSSIPNDKWFCDICQVKATSKRDLRKHISGRKHKVKEVAIKTQKSAWENDENDCGSSNITCESDGSKEQLRASDANATSIVVEMPQRKKKKKKN